MKLNYLCLVLLMGIFILCGCNKNSNDSNNIPITQVTFADKGRTVLDPISTTVTIRSDSIESVSLQSGAITKQWSKPIQPSDFDSVQKIINKYSLFYCKDIVRGEDQLHEVGWYGMTITMNGTESSHTFEIMGDVPKDKWPEGVHTLVELKDELVAKYQ